MRSWREEAGLGEYRGKRLRRYVDREGMRREWYELGFRDGWKARGEIEEGKTGTETEKEKER